MAPKQPSAGPSRIKATQPASSPPPPASSGAWNPPRTLFALALPVLGTAEKITVWDVITDQVVSEWEVEGASQVSTICWTTVNSSDSSSGKKKKAKREGNDSDEVIVVTTTEGQLLVYSPSKGLVLRKWSLSARATATWFSEYGVLLATSTSILLLSPDASFIAKTFPLPPNTPAPTAMAVLASSTTNVIQLLISSTSAMILQLNLSSGKISNSSTPLAVSTSNVSSLHPLPPSPSGASFLVASEEDRTVSQYTIPPKTTTAKLAYRYAPPTLSPVHSIAASPSLVSVLHISGEISLFPLATEVDLARPKTDSKPNTVKLIEGKAERLQRVCRVTFSPTKGQSDVLLCGRLAGGGRVKWYKAPYRSDEGGINTETIVKCDAQDLLAEPTDASVTPLQRFVPPTTNVDAPAEVTDETEAPLPTDVDMADVSLGERLLALPNGALPNGDTHDSNTKAPAIAAADVNPASLTRILVQALHTSDPALLSLCLTHRDPILIRNTIRKLPATMALPLLKACVERLGQGKGANRRGGGRGMGQGEQQGRGTVEWVKGVLVERGAILMTMPSLPQHLATLSSLLQTRLALQQPLLALSGRLDLALAQIQLRRIAAEQTSGGKDGDQEGYHYIEGESEDEEVPIEYGEEGVIEDVDMRLANGNLSEDDDSDEEEDDEDDDDDVLESDDEDGGFLDLEAEESEEDDEESEED